MELLKISEKFEAAELKSAARALHEGGLVVFPRETTYALATNFTSEASVKRIWELRGQAAESAPVIHIADRESVVRWAARVPGPAHRLMKRFWPGPLTFVLPARAGGEIGLRFPSHKAAQELIRLVKGPIVAASAGLAGEPPCVRGDDAARLFRDKVDWIIDAGETRYRTRSTVVRVDETKVEILREGAIKRGLIEELSYRLVLFVCTGNTCRSPMAEAVARELKARQYKIAPEELERAKGLRLMSAGTGAGEGQEMSSIARQVLEELGFHPPRHSSRPLGFPLVEEADRIFVMTHGHREQILDWVPEAAPKVHLLDPAGRDVEDPISGDADVYRDCAMHIRKCIEARLKEL